MRGSHGWSTSHHGLGDYISTVDNNYTLIPILQYSQGIDCAQY